MIWSDFHFFSEALQIQTAVYVLLPEAAHTEYENLRPIPALYLFHGLSDDHTMWLRNTRIAQYARRYRLAVVMPAVNRSFYSDMAHGAKYWTYVSEELPRVMETFFPLSRAREGRFAAGLSMGGYGAMKLGLLKPDRYAAIAALSAPLRLEETVEHHTEDPEFWRELMDIFGDPQALVNGVGNLSLAAEALKPEDAPKMFVACGTEDFLFEANEAFTAQFKEKFHIDYRTQKGATHNWDFWDPAIRDALAWLPLEKLDNVW